MGQHIAVSHFIADGDGQGLPEVVDVELSAALHKERTDAHVGELQVVGRKELVDGFLRAPVEEQRNDVGGRFVSPQKVVSHFHHPVVHVLNVHGNRRLPRQHHGTIAARMADAEVLTVGQEGLAVGIV